MLAKLQKWGNSQGVRFSKSVLEESSIAIGEVLEISVKKGVITIKPASQIRGRIKLEDLVKKLPKNSKTHEVDWGKPEGKEEW